jgi:hypothetical protein
VPYAITPVVPILATLLALPAGLLMLPAALAAQAPLERLQAEDPAAGDLFGCALDLAFDAEGAAPRGVLLVGSLNDDDLGPDSGSAYVYELLPGAAAWVQTAKLLAPGAATGDRTGFSVAVDRGPRTSAGDRALLGAPGSGPGGAVHLFRRIDEEWLPVARLATPEAGAGLGSSVLFHGDEVLTGAPTAGAGGRRAAGVVLRFGSNGGELRRYRAAEPQDDAGFGWAIDASDRREGEPGLVAVGAPWEDTPATDAGAVHVVTESGFPVARVVAPDGRAFDAFGYSVAIDGLLLAVGAPRAAGGAGAVYVFARGPFDYELEARFVGAPGDQLGTDVVLNGGTLAAGARGEDGSRGAVRFYRRGEAGWSETRRVQPPGARPGDEVGIAVALSGGSFALGAYRDDGGGTDTGAVYAEVVELAEDPPPPDPMPPTPGLLPVEVIAVLGVEGPTVEGRTVTYVLELANLGPGALRDRAGDEVTLPIPVQLVPVAGRATAGTVRIDPPAAPSLDPRWTAAWNGRLGPGGFETVEIDAMIRAGTGRTQAATQAVVKVPRADDVSSAPPGAPEPGPTVLLIVSPIDVPALSAYGLALLAALFAAGGLAFLRR